MTAPTLHGLMPGWHKAAACAGVDPATFFPDAKAGKAYAAASAVCHSCPVVWQCLDDALDEEHDLGTQGRYGMRGGLDPEQRARLTAAQRKTVRRMTAEAAIS